MANIIILEQISDCCPEQYWARKGANIIGYIRLRWGHLYCDYLPYGNLKDDNIRLLDHYFDNEFKGMFGTEEERKYWLDKCKSELLKKYNKLHKNK